MKRATMSLPDDLAEAVDNYLRAQEVPPTLTAVVQTTLREYLRERGFLQVRRPLKIGASGYLVGVGSRSNPPQWK